MPIAASAPDVFHRLHDYWLTLKRHREVPLRHQLDPAEIGYALANAALVEIEDAPFRVRYRVVGNNLNELYGSSMTGRYADELYPPPIQSEVHAAYRSMIASAAPIYARRGFSVMTIALGYDRLILPFSRDGTRIDMALLVLYAVDASVRTAADWQIIREVPPEWVLTE